MNTRNRFVPAATLVMGLAASSWSGQDAPTAAGPPLPSKTAERLEKLGISTTLRKLRDDDPDQSVREAAAGALERLASAKKKQP